MNRVRAEVMNREAQLNNSSNNNNSNINHHSHPPRGIKRPQDDDSLDDDHRFAKRFHLLNIANQKSLYIPTPSSSQQQQDNAQTPTTPRTSPTLDDCMHLDDTKHRVYIHNLDDELADIEAAEDKLIFLPDIDKHLHKIPHHILHGGVPASSSSPKEKQELVLYSIPSSLSVPEEHDGVRKAIIEARQRAREKAARDAAIEEISRGPDNPEIAHGLDAEEYLLEDEADADGDPDAMEIE